MYVRVHVDTVEEAAERLPGLSPSNNEISLFPPLDLAVLLIVHAPFGSSGHGQGERVRD